MPAPFLRRWQSDQISAVDRRASGPRPAPDTTKHNIPKRKQHRLAKIHRVALCVGTPGLNYSVSHAVRWAGQSYKHSLGRTRNNLIISDSFALPGQKASERSEVHTRHQFIHRSLLKDVPSSHA